MKKIKKIKFKLVYKLMVSYVAIFLVMLGILFTISHVVENRMNKYFENRIENSIKKIINNFGENLSIEEYGNIRELFYKIEWPPGMEILYYNESGEKILELKKQTPNMNDLHSKNQIPKGVLKNNLIQKKYPVEHEGKNYGFIHISYYARNNLNNTDIVFIREISNVLKVMMSFVIILGIILSIFMSRSITKPILKVSKTANAIRHGELKTRANIKSNTSEIVELSDSINYLADTLEKEDMLRRQMTSDMAHEIRTPLTTLKNFFEAFIDGVWEPNEEYLKKCYDEITRMTDLVDKLKDIAKLEETNLKLNNEKFNLSTELNSIIKLFEPQLKSKNINLVIDIEENIYVNMDKAKISQIIGNLLSNAYRYTDQGGQVKVQLYQDSMKTIIHVIDNGIGISKSDLPYLFERFYRTEKSRNRETGGMGIGLTIVKKLVNLYKGSIYVDSKIGEGTTFTIEFENHVIN